MLEHGGNVLAAARQYAIPVGEWLDLSTGVNPQGWVVPPCPPEIWRALPDSGDNLLAAARSYYGCGLLLAVAGSQAAIQTLPLLRAHSRVGIISPSYNEHRHAWLRRGHLVAALAPAEIEQALDELDVLVVCNPNNPSGDRFSPDRLKGWHEKLAQRNGWLIVDEAFIDPTADCSVIGSAQKPGLIVLRSMGKFFGMAGTRIGFVAAENKFLSALEDELGPWTIAGPSRWAATLALKDRVWQEAAVKRLRADSLRLCRLLTQSGIPPAGGTVFFQWAVSNRAREIHESLASRAILTRYISQPESIRFGLPGNEDAWVRLQNALSGLT